MRSHHHLFAWRKANANAVAIHRLAAERWVPSRGSIYDQLRRAALSVPLNIAEGNAFGPGGRCRFHMRVAYGSAVETTELLRILDELGDGAPELLAASTEVQALTLLLLKSQK